MRYAKFIIIIIVFPFFCFGCNDQSEVLRNEQLKLKQEVSELESRISKLEQKHLISESYVQKRLENSGSITVNDLSGKFINNKNAGELFVINGTVTNQFIIPKSKVQLVGKIFDKKGKVTNEQKAFCGEPIEDEILKNLSLEELRNIMNNSKNSDLKPSAKVPFTIIFSSPSKDLNEFSVDVVQAK
jgi:hypothetical protein